MVRISRHLEEHCSKDMYVEDLAPSADVIHAFAIHKLQHKSYEYRLPSTSHNCSARSHYAFQLWQLG